MNCAMMCDKSWARYNRWSGAFHAVIGRLYGYENTRQGLPGNEIFWSSFAAFWVIYGSMAYLDRRERQARRSG